jgi:hypothetical protein
MANTKIARQWAPARAGALAQITVGVDGIVELRELDEPNAPPMNAPNSPALHNFAKCLLVAMQEFDKALARAYRLCEPSLFDKTAPIRINPTVSAYDAPGQKYRVRRAKRPRPQSFTP